MTVKTWDKTQKKIRYKKNQQREKRKKIKETQGSGKTLRNKKKYKSIK